LISFLDKFVAVLTRDLLTAMRQRKSFLTLGLSLLFEMLGLYFLAHAIGPQFRPEGGEYFPFLVVGVAFFNFLLAGIDGFISAVHDSQVSGTIEALMNTSTPPFVVVLLSAISSLLGRCAHMLLYVIVGLMMVPLPAHRPNVAGCLLILGLSIACASSFGILAAAVQIWSQRGSAMVWLFGSVLWLLSGTMFPVAALPAILQKPAAWLPFTHSLNGLRLALLQGAGMGQLWIPILSLLVFSVVLYPLSVFAFSLAMRNARQRGTLAFY
jgi:ABC-2 type transport system permease protein